MEEGKRQKQVGLLILEELTGILRHMGLHMVDGALVSISAVRMTPDLMEARVYLSIYKPEDAEAVLEHISERQGEIKWQLGKKLRHSLRRIPELFFFADNTLDEVFKIDQIFKKIHEEKKSKEE